MEHNKEANIKGKLLCKELLRSLTLDERNLLTFNTERPQVEEALNKYASFSSRANLEKVIKKSTSEGLKENDYAMAFYDFDNNKVNNKMKVYIEKQEWFIFLTAALCNFESEKNKNEILLESCYNMTYTTWFLAKYAKKELVEHIGNMKNISVSNIVVDKIITQATNGCLHIHCKTVIYDYYLNKDKYDGDKKLFKYIKDNFSSADSIIAFYLKFPVIIRRLCCKMLNTLNYYKEVFSDIDNIYLELCEKKFVESNVIIDIICGEGDTHENGKSVVMLRFGNNEILYKPRELKISKKFFAFINALNQNFNLYKLPVIKSIWRDTFTIEEKIPYKGCVTKSEIKRFYVRMGYYLGILYLFNGNDIHYENIIANGEYPCIIDLETMFAHSTEQMESSGSAIENVLYIVNHSVKSCHLLPSYIFSKNSKNDFADVSGIGGKRAKLPEEKLVLTNWDTDDICFEMKELYLSDHSNIPMMNEKRVDYKNYTDEIIRGFNDFMRIIIGNKDFFKEQINLFSGVRTRQVLRATNDYGYMLEFASHPNYTRDMILFERFLDAVWVFPYKNPHISKCESIDLLNDDIPIFYCDSDSRDIINCHGEKISNVYEISGINSALTRIDEISEKNVKMQTLLIRDSLGLLNDWLIEETRKAIDRYRFALSEKETDIKNLWENKLSRKIMNILNDSAIYGSNDVSWLALKKLNGKVVFNSVSDISVALFDGLAGILYYLLSDRKTSDTELVSKIVVSIGQIRDMDVLKQPISGTCGMASVLLPLYMYSIGKKSKNSTPEIYNSILNWCESQLNTQENIEFSELASALILFTLIYEKSENYRYISFMNKTATIFVSGCRTYINHSTYMVREKIRYALYRANLTLEDESVEKLISDISKLNEPFYKSGKFIQSEKLPDIYEYYRLCSYITKEVNAGIDNEYTVSIMKNALEYVRISEEYDPELILLRIDLLQEYYAAKDFSKEADKLCGKELEKLICISGLSDDENCTYDTIVNGISLDSLLCGLGIRIKRYLGMLDDTSWFLF